MRAAKLEPVTLQVFAGVDEKARYSSIWQQSAMTGVSSWNNDEGTFGDRSLSDGLPVDVNLLPSRQYVRDAQGELLAWLSASPWAGIAARLENPILPHPERRYAGTFQANPGFDGVAVNGLAPVPHLARCRELARQDYRP